MIFRLKDVSHIAVRGLELELHFNDTSSHMRRFASVDEMIEEMKWWQFRSEALDYSNSPQLSALMPSGLATAALYSSMSS